MRRRITKSHHALPLLPQVGRLVAGFGVGFVSAIIILYMSEIAPRKVRGAIVSGYQFCITIGIMVSVLPQTTSQKESGAHLLHPQLASIINNFTQDRADSGSYRIPIGIQFAWGLIL